MTIVVKSKEVKIGKKSYFKVMVDIDESFVSGNTEVISASWTTGGSIDQPFGVSLVSVHAMINQDEIHDDASFDTLTGMAGTVAVGKEEFVKGSVEPSDINHSSLIASIRVVGGTSGSQYASPVVFVEDGRIDNEVCTKPEIHIGWGFQVTGSQVHTMKARLLFEKIKMTENNYLKSVVGSC